MGKDEVSLKPKLFLNESCKWKVYDKYIFEENENGDLCIIPDQKASYHNYDPCLCEPEEETKEKGIYADFLDIEFLLDKELRGLLSPRSSNKLDRTIEKEIGNQIMGFVKKYGLLGLDTIYKNNCFNRLGYSCEDYYDERIIFDPRQSTKNTHIDIQNHNYGEPIYLIIDAYEKIYRHKAYWDTYVNQGKPSLDAVCPPLFNEFEIGGKMTWRTMLSLFSIEDNYKIRLIFDQDDEIWKIRHEFLTLYDVIRMKHMINATRRVQVIKNCVNCGIAFVAKSNKAERCSSSCGKSKSVSLSKSNKKHAQRLIRDGKSTEEISRIIPKMKLWNIEKMIQKFKNGEWE